MPFEESGNKTALAEEKQNRRPLIALVTHGVPQDEIPVELGDASDQVIDGAIPLLRNNRLPPGSDGAILWMKGDQLLEGSSEILREAVVFSPGRTLVPVHLPCLPELDLLGLQPRIWTRGQAPDQIANHFRIAGSVSPSPEFVEFLEEEGSKEPWARIYRPLLGASINPRKASEDLFAFWSDSPVLLPTLRALLLYNLIVLAIRVVEIGQASKLAGLAMDYFPRSAELAFLAGWLAVKEGNLASARHFAQQAIESGDPAYAGCGGERSYRSQWLLGLAFELEGKQRDAIENYSHGAVRRPAYPPAVLGLLRQRLWYDHARALTSTVFSDLVQREPQYLELVLHFLLLHRLFDPAQEMLGSSPASDEQRHRLQSALDERAAAFRSQPRKKKVAPGVLLIGNFWVNSSLARINRELAAALSAQPGLEVAMEPADFANAPGKTLPHFEAISEGLKHRLKRLDLTIRHYWLPDFGPVPCGKLVVTFPWESGSMPVQWVEQIRQNVTEMWVPSQFTKDVLLSTGVESERVQVIPNGVDTNIFTPEGSKWRPEGCRSFVFLFVGGAIARKGADLLWNAYSRAFSSHDDVSLVVKDLGSATVYARTSLLDLLRAAARKPGAPHLMILTEELEDSNLASLYRGCDVFALPYRGEGFGMPLAEALACGKPVITTGLGPAREFCSSEASFFIPARIIEMPGVQNEFGPMTGPRTWFEPDTNELARTMRYLYERRDEAAGKGVLGVQTIRERLAWDRIALMQMERIRRLTEP